MSTFDLISDAPGLLRAESITMALKFERTSDTTGRVSWNIPAPAAGCAASTQAYDGMLVAIDTIPSTVDKIPTAGVIYNSDPTGDRNLFAGDSLKTSMIIGAFYNNRTTTMLDVSGLKPNIPYYVTGYPIDAQYRYFVEGVHAYSTSLLNGGTSDTQGSQVVVLNSDHAQSGVNEHDATGLLPTTQYSFDIQIGTDPKQLRALDSTECKLVAHKSTIVVSGAAAQTYDDLVNQLNIQFAKLTPAPLSPTPPNAGGYYWNAAAQKLFVWNGLVHTQIPIIIDTLTPNTIVEGTYWINPTTNILSRWTSGAWVIATVLTNAYDPSVPRADTSYWYDGVTANLWNGVTWCNVKTYNQSIDPSLAAIPTEGSFWYNSSTLQLLRWDTNLDMWFAADAVKSTYDINNIPDGAHWFNQTNNTLYVRSAATSTWSIVSAIALSEHSPMTPAPGKFWYNPTTQVLLQRNTLNNQWITVDVTVYPVDPALTIGSCSLWWNTAANVINTWSIQFHSWFPITMFYQQSTDPSSAPLLSEGTAWYTNGTLSVWHNNCFKLVQFTDSIGDPRYTLPDGIVWHNTTTNMWYVRNVGWISNSNSATYVRNNVDGWTTITLLASIADPFNLPVGSFWYNPTNSGLFVWNGIAWVSVMYSAVSYTPLKNSLWFNTTTNKLMSWNGVGYDLAPVLAFAQLDCNGNLLVTETAGGSTSQIRITDIDLFKSLTALFQIHTSKPGTDGASGTPSYAELGIGDSGDDSIRKKMANEIRMELGGEIITVELTANMLDHAINIALEVLRQKSSIGYKRGFFFMLVKPHEQRYFLTNKVSGMNKIVDILGVQRQRGSSAAGIGHEGGINGQIVAQHLYNAGTFDLLSYHMMAEYGKLMEVLFATRIVYSWNEQTREIWLHQNFPYGETTVMIEATVERSEQDLLSDRYCKAWLRSYAAASSRLMLAEVRGKFSSLPGAGGSVSLNADALRSQAQSEQEALLGEITSYVVDRPEEWGVGSTVVYG